MRFSDLPLEETILQGIQDAGFVDCTGVQEQTMKHALQGRDVCVQSQTGTGKTAAYLVSVFQLMLTRSELKDRPTVIIAPTRELAVQIEQEAQLLGSHLPLRIGCFYGGVGYVPQEKLLADGVDIIIGTPGRLIDFTQSGKLDFSRVGIVVIDEADRLFDMGFYPDIRRMLRKMPPREKRTSMLFSATLGVNARNIAWEHMNDPVEVEINPENVTLDAITQVLYHVSKSEKFRLLLGLLRKEKPETAIIFTNTKRSAEEVSRRLEMNGFTSTFIMGDLPQRKRLRVIEAIKAGKVRLLVATDVAARGLHIDDLDMVINYDLPEDRESYVHRIGRTARAGKTGKAVSLADEQHVFNLEGIEAFLGAKIPTEHTSDDLLEEDVTHGARIQLGLYHLDEGERRATRGAGRPERRGEADSRHRRPARPAAGDGRRDRPAATQRTDTRAHVERTTAEPARNVQQRPAPLPRQAPQQQRTANRPRPKPAPANLVGSRPAAAKTQADRPGQRAPIDERIEYYRKKYGENFSHAPTEKQPPNGGRKRPAETGTAVQRPESSTGNAKATGGIWSRIVGLFRGGKPDK